MSEPSAVARRLKELREGAQPKISIREVADAIGKPHTSYAHYESGYKKPYLPLDLIEELIPVLTPRGVDADELYALAGVHPASRKAPGPKEAPARPRPARARVAAIAEVDVRAAAGDGGLLEHDHDEPLVARWEMPTDLIAGQTTAGFADLRIIRVYGNSMVPDFMPGERVLVDTSDRRPSPAGVFVVWDGFGIVVKYLEIVPYSDPPVVRLISRNGTFGTYERLLEEVVINGRVIGKWQWT